MTAAHECPGRCGTSVARARFACPACWRRLPMALRRAITMAHNAREVAAHRAAMADAMDWLRDQG